MYTCEQTHPSVPIKMSLRVVPVEWYDASPWLRDVVNSVGPCTIGRQDQPLFAYLCGCLLGQRIRFCTAQALRSRLYEVIGSRCFTPEDVLALSDDDWARVRCGERKRNQLIALAQSPDDWEHCDGIGPWTRDCVKVQFGLDPDLFPNDKHVLHVMRQRLQDAQLTAAQAGSYAKRHWAPMRSVAFWYLWKSGL